MALAALSRPSRAIFWAWLSGIIGNFGGKSVFCGVLRRFFIIPVGSIILAKEGRGVK